MLEIPFDHDFSEWTAERFIEELLVDTIGLHHFLAGPDCRFGRQRAGDAGMLREFGERAGFTVESVEPVVALGGVVSSSRIRKLVSSAGDVAAAGRLLGRPVRLSGTVIKGDQRGRTIGFPTLNLHLGSTVRPALGVYAVRVGIFEGGETIWHDGVANVGKRPTFGGEDVILEAHLMDFSGDLYGKLIAVTLIDFIRAEKKFDGLEALRAQIAADTKTAQNILAEAPA